MSSNRLALVTIAAAALVVAACNPTPSPSPSAAPERTFAPTATAAGSPPAASPGASSGTGDAVVYATIREQVEVIRGLQPTAEVEPVTIDEAQLRENLEAEIDAEQSPEEMALAEDLLETLGFIPKGASLRAETLDLFAGQVIGYYSPDRDELFVVSKTGQTVGTIERVTYAHEFTHQLQDQTFDLATIDTGELDQSDRGLARLALIEGDAASVQTQWMIEQLTPDQLIEVLAAGQDPEALAALNNAPAYLSMTAVFPYDIGGGLGLVQQVIGEGGFEAVDAAFADPPASTEQVIHPEKYLEREDPIAVNIPDDIAAKVGNGWSESARDTLGELILRIWLQEHGVGPKPAPLDPPGEAATKAVAGWGGDRLVLLRHADGSLAVAMATTWDTSADAAEFAQAAQRALSGPGLDGQLFHRQGSRDVLVSIGDEAASVLAALRA